MFEEGAAADPSRSGKEQDSKFEEGDGADPRRSVKEQDQSWKRRRKEPPAFKNESQKRKQATFLSVHIN